MITFTNGSETGRDSSRRVSLPCARVKTVIHNKLHIRFSAGHLHTAENLKNTPTLGHHKRTDIVRVTSFVRKIEKHPHSWTFTKGGGPTLGPMLKSLHRDHFALILPNNPQYQLGWSVSYGFDRRTTNQPVFFAKSHV